MKTDSDIARLFADRVNIDGQFEGARVTLTGAFEAIGLAGLARLAASDFRFVSGIVGLVAVLPDGVSPELGVGYSITGVLKGVGEFALFPGIVIDELKRA
jgi:hypothetical protein